jgi:UDP-N-acetylmuramate--alanine ligase
MLTTKKILFMGIGGAGLSNIAQIYKEMSYQVIGTDQIRNSATQILENQGFIIKSEKEVLRDQELLKSLDIVFKSSAIKDENELLTAIIALKLEVITRHDFFAQLSATREVIAIAGSSGKTSTTGIVSHVLKSKFDIGYLIGVHGNGGSLGSDPKFVIEADEYAKTFLSLTHNKIGVITAINYDHVDIYPTLDDYQSAFRQFAKSCTKLFVNGDNQTTLDVLKGFDKITFGYQKTNDYFVSDIEYVKGGSVFNVYHLNQKIITINLNLVGAHNIINALASIVVALDQGLSIEQIHNALANYRGEKRRLQCLQTAPFYIYDDYAHLPYEISTVLSGVRQSFGNAKIICYFQGHTYTRINAFFNDYTKSFVNCNKLYLANIYAARDSIGSVDLDLMSKLIKQNNHKLDIVLSGTVEQSLELLKQESLLLEEGDVLIILSAGDGTTIGHSIANLYHNT